MRAIRLLYFCLCALSLGAAPVSIIPSAAPRGARVLITGSGLDAPDLAAAFTDASGNPVAARILATATAYAEVAVPAAAVSGPVRVTAGGSTTPLPFTVAPDPTFATVTTLALSTKANDNFKALGGVALMPNGTALIADTAHNVVQLVAPGAAPVVIAGQWAKSGYADGAAAQALFKSPAGMAYDPVANIIYVADTGNNVIRRIAADGTVSTLAGNGQAGSLDGTGAAAQFKAPQAIALDAQGNIYVADTGNSEIRRITPSGAVTTIAGTPRAGFADGSAAQALFSAPAGIAVDRDGNIYVADGGNNRIRKVSNGVVATIAGNAQQGLVDGFATLAQFKAPGGMAVDAAGNVYVSDTGNAVIRLIANGSVTTIAGDPKQQGYLDGTASAAQFKAPAGLAVAGGIFIADSGNDALRLIVPELRFSAVYPPNGPEAGGNTIRLLGTGFILGQTNVAIAATRVDTALVSSTELLITMPPGTGQTSITVATAAGSITLPNCYTYLPPPTVTAVQPAKGRTAGGDTVTISGTNFGTASDTTVTFGSASATISAITATTITVLTPPNTAGTVDVTVTTAVGSAKRTGGFTYLDPPAITLVTPSRGKLAGGDGISISGSNFDDATTTVKVGGNPATNVIVVSPALVRATTPAGAAGAATVTVSTAGGTASLTGGFIYVPPPAIASFNPASGAAGSVVTITGQNFEPAATNDAVTIGGVLATVTSASTTQLIATVPLNAITGRITVTTAGGTAISATDFIVATFRSLTVTAPTTSLQPGTQQQFNAIATLLDNTTRDVTSSAVWTSSNPSVATVSAGGVVHALAAGSADVSASYAGYNATAHVSVQATLTLPPATLQGPPIDQTIAVPLADSLRFLYTGVNAPQTGVAQNAIDDTRVAVISGRVMDRAGLALGGVAITVAGHSEYGQTTTRGDGRYDVAFNGGGALHLVFTKPGFIAADRIVTTTWNQQKPLEDIALVQYDSAVTAVTTGAAVNQIAQGSSVTDADGTRRATVLIPAGVTATVTDANGIQQQVSTLHLRATEFTAGATGRQAMPAALPPASGYTYCVELSVDEGASVSFSKPLPVYVDNFINFPVGTAVPVGYFDRSTQQWVPSPNGVVLKILSISNGVAAIDSTGTGQPDSSTRLAALAVDSAELAQLGSTYVTGKTLWRFRVAHFSPWDSNFPYGPPSDAAFPPATAPDQPMWIPGCEHECGSVIEVENQTLGESVPVAGTPYGLHYNSGLHDRTKYRATVHVTGASIPASLSAVSVTVSIAGRYSTQNLTPSPNVDVVIDWDGRDAYGRPVQGTRVAEVTVAYKYAAQYRSPGTVDPAFAQPPARATIIGDRARAELSYAQNWKIALGNTAPDTGFGDWTFGAQRSYDPVSRLLVEGDGSIHAPDMTHTGEAALYNAGPGVHAIAPAPDGGYYYVDSRCTVVRVDARGLSSTVAGVPGSCGYTTPDGVPPLTPIAPYGPIAVGPDGAVYFADQAQITMPWGPVGVRIVRRLGGGRMDVVAGGGTGGDGGPAKLARIVEISALTVAADGSLFIADPKTFNPVAVGGDCNCIHRVGTDGMMTMYAGLILGVANLPPAFQLYFGDYLSSLTGLAAAPDGSLYWSTRQRIGRITPDGNVQPVTSPGLAPHDGDAAIAASPGADGGIALAPDGSLIIGDPGFGRVWVITGGVIHVLGGTGVTSNATIADGTLAKAAALGAGGVAVTPDGSVLMSSASRVYRTQPVFPPLRPGAPAVIPAADGVAGYIFENVRHSRTVNTLTGTTLERLSYDSHGYLVSVTDVDNQTTTIERDSTGKPTAIIAPGGQRTSLTLDAQGRLQSVTDPSNAAWQFSYNNLGLLSQLTDPRQGLHKFTYDDLGRLTKDENPAGGFIALGRSGSSTLFSVLRNTAEGRTSSTAFQQGSWMQTTRPITGKDGLITARAENGDGSRTETTPSGVIIQRTMSPDSRFSMAAAFESFSSAQMPSGLKRSVTSSRQVTLSDPNDLLSVTSMTASMTVNGRSFSSTFNKATRVLTSTSATGRTQSVSYDANDHPVSQQIPGLATVQLGYESHGLVTSVVSGARQTSMTYDDHFRVKTITDPLHRTVSFEYDAADRVKLQTLPDGRQIAFTYDAAGNATSITPPSRPAHAFTFTAVDLLDTYTPPSVANVTATRTSYTWNRDKQLTSVQRPDGALLSFNYDNAGRLATVAEPLGTHTYSYDAAKGTLARVVTPDGSVAFTYDGGLPIGVTSAAGPVSGSVGFAYDSSFRMTGETVNGTSTIAFGYDDDDLLITAGALSLHRDAANGHLTGTTLGNITDSYTYNTFGEPTAYSVQLNGANIFTLGYTRDDAGRIAARTETVNGTTTLTSYTYDNAGRLTDVNTAGANTHYGYDANGNRTSVESPSGTITATYDAQDRLITGNGASYFYSDNGELQKKIDSTGTTTYTYDVFGNLRHVALADGTLIDYVIDAMNRRVGKKVNGTLSAGWIYSDALHIVAETDGTGAVTKRFVYGSRSNSPDYMLYNGVTYRLIDDERGSIRYVMDAASGTVAEALTYDAWGNLLSDANPGLQPFGFAGGLNDNQTRFTRLGAREYDGATGRWTSKDPIGVEFVQANLYAYSGADPVNYYDPSGLADKLTIYSESAPGSSAPITDGHSFVVLTPDGGAPVSYGLYGPMVQAPRGLDENWEIDHWNNYANRTGDYSVVTRTRFIDAAHEAALKDVISRYKAMGSDAWTSQRTCSTFASDAWRAATGESLDTKSHGDIFPNPSALGQSIVRMNGGIGARVVRMP